MLIRIVSFLIGRTSDPLARHPAAADRENLADETGRRVGAKVSGELRDIEDNGPGLSVEELELARRPFFTTKTHGLGLGLNLAEKILEAHQGRLNLTGEFGAGVRASIALPAGRLPS